MAARDIVPFRKPTTWLPSGLGALGLLLWSSHALASKTFPKYLQEELMLPAEPPCTLCHQTNDGGAKTATKPFGLSMTYLQVNPGSGRGRVVDALHSSEAQMIDSDGDGVIDIDELRMGSDPNIGANGEAPSTLVPMTGCTINRRPANTGFLGAVALLALGLHRRRRSARALGLAAPLAFLMLSTPAQAETPQQDAPAKAKPALSRQIGELGLFTGVLATDSDDQLAGGPEAERSFSGIAPSFGARLALLPLSVGGVEGEVDYTSAMTSQDDHVSLWQLRAHVLGQLPLDVLTPFAMIGIGSVRAVGPSTSDRPEMALQYGTGLKFDIDPAWGLRIDVRDSMTWGGESVAHHTEILFGFRLLLRPPGVWSSG